MRSFFVACIAAALVGAVWADCNACIDGYCYVKHIIPDADSHRLARCADIDKNANKLYIIVDEHTIKKCNLVTATCENTANQWNIDQIAVDQRTGDIYATVYPGSGIYKLDLDNNKRVLLDAGATYVGDMVFKDKLYYASIDKGIFTSEGGMSRIVAGTGDYKVMYLVVDKRDDIYFLDITNSEKQFTGRLSGGVVDRTNLPENLFRWSVDQDGNAMFFDVDTNAVCRFTNDQSVEVGYVNDTTHYFYNFLFGRNNDLIYSANNKYYYFKKDKERCTITVTGNRRVITETVVSSTVPPIATTSLATDDSGASGTININKI